MTGVQTCALPIFGVGHQGRDQFQNVLFAVDIGEGVVVHRLFEVDGVQNFYLITIFQHGLPTFKHDCTFRIGYDIGTMALQEVRFQPKSRFTRAGAADHQHVFVPGVLGVRWTVGHHQAFRFGQDDVVCKLGCHERSGFFFECLVVEGGSFADLCLYAAVLDTEG